MKYDYNGIENTPPNLLEICWLEFSEMAEKVKSEYNIDCGSSDFDTIKLCFCTCEYNYEYIEFDFLDSKGNSRGYGSRVAYFDSTSNNIPFYEFHITGDNRAYVFSHDYDFNSYHFIIEEPGYKEAFDELDGF